VAWNKSKAHPLGHSLARLLPEESAAPASGAISRPETGCARARARAMDRWKTLVSAQRANKVPAVPSGCRYIFYTRYRQHLQPRAIEFPLVRVVLSFVLPLGPHPALSSPSLCLSPRERVFCRLLVCGLRSKPSGTRDQAYTTSLNSSRAAAESRKNVPPSTHVMQEK